MLLKKVQAGRKFRKLAGVLCAAALAGSLSACGGGAAGASSAAPASSEAVSGSQAAPASSAAGAEGQASASSGAATAQGQAGGSTEGKPIQIVTAMFPEYDWTREILGDHAGNAEITLLMDNGTDLHSFQPTAEDMMRIASCDLFIYTGGPSAQWAEKALKTAVNQDMVVLDLMDALGDRVKEEEIVEGMQHEHDHEHEGEDHDHEAEDHDHDAEEHDHEAEGHDHEAGEADEHVWLSLKNASFLCGEIEKALAEADPANAALYKTNLAAYQAKLDALDKEYQAAVDAAAVKTLLFGDRFPFRYLVDDYGLSYYAAFSGCSAETEASFETITFLANKADEIPVSCVMTIDGSDGRIAETIARSTKSKDQKILTLNSMQSVTEKQVKDGVTYLSVMEENLNVLKEALGE